MYSQACFFPEVCKPGGSSSSRVLLHAKELPPTKAASCFAMVAFKWDYPKCNQRLAFFWSFQLVEDNGPVPQYSNIHGGCLVLRSSKMNSLWALQEILGSQVAGDPALSDERQTREERYWKRQLLRFLHWNKSTIHRNWISSRFAAVRVQERERRRSDGWHGLDDERYRVTETNLVETLISVY